MRSTSLTFLSLFFLVVFCFGIKAQTDIKAEEKRWAEFKIKKEIIEREANESDSDWAGEYEMSDRFLTIAPKAGYAFLLRRYAFDWVYVAGDIQWSEKKLKLITAEDSKWQRLSIFSSELVPVLWGERHYLIPENEIIDFINSVNAGYEPTSKLASFGTSFFLRKADKNKQVSGAPILPEQYRGYLLKKPIRARILEIGKTVESTDEDGEQNKVTTVILNVGSDQGVKTGMEFMTVNPSVVHEKVKITKVKKDKSEGQIIQSSSYATPANLSWILSTNAFDKF
jgi:hypothetical protein